MMKKRKKRYADGGGVDEELIVEGMRPQNFNLASLARGPSSGGMGPSMPGGGGGMPAPMRSSAPTRTPMPIARTAGYLGPTIRGEGGERVSLGVGRRGAIGAGAAIPFKKGGKVKKRAKGGKLTDLTGDGKVTRADVLKGRGVPGFSKGGSTASKRADGCATKGKTKGRFV
jgi:hypothetical protein